MKVKYDAPGMVGQRGRNDNGLLRKKEVIPKLLPLKNRTM